VTDEEILQLARGCGLECFNTDGANRLIAFANAVMAAAREVLAEIGEMK
jgi:hypothetical protein